MNKHNKLASTLAAAVAVTTLFGASAFAETRHRDRSEQGTQQQSDRGGNWRGRDGGNGSLNHDGRMERQRADAMQQRDRGFDNRGSNNFNNRNENRGFNNDRRGYDNNRGLNNDRRGYDNNRNFDNRSFNNDRRGDNRGFDNRGFNNDRRGYDNRSFDNRGYDRRGEGSRGRSIFSEGRVTNFRHERDGYRVWLDGGRYPFFVPEARWRAFPLRVGISVRLGGYYDPLGYIYADTIGPYGGGSVYSAGGLHGVVESVDYRRGTLVVHDDISGAFVTAVMRGGDYDFGTLRPGDYVDLSGDWTRGIFQAYRVDDVRGGGYGRY
jgi:hypothetical protein